MKSSSHRERERSSNLTRKNNKDNGASGLRQGDDVHDEVTKNSNDAEDHLHRHRNVDDDEDEDRALLSPLEIDDNDNTGGDSFHDDDDASSAILCGWIVRSLVVLGIAILPLVVGYVFLDRRNDLPYENRNKKGELRVRLPYEWDPDQSHERCDESSDTFIKLKNKIESKSEPNCPDLCQVPTQYCECDNPTISMAREYGKEVWMESFEKTKAIAAQAYKEFGMQNDLQVVLLGDSITEHWLGTAGGGHPRKEYEDHAKIFRRLFTKQGGGKINGVPLGISMDTIPQLIYRVENGGLGNLHPKVFWILIGTNDLSTKGCSVESIVAGHIALVEDVQSHRPDAVAIVINGLLPRQGIFMPNINKINQQLQCYADITPGVEFFNATGIFWDPELDQLRGLPDEIHPDAESSLVWGHAIVNQVQRLIHQHPRS